MGGQREVEPKKKWRPKRGERLEGSRGQNTVEDEMGWEAEMGLEAEMGWEAGGK